MQYSFNDNSQPLKHVQLHLAVVKTMQEIRKYLQQTVMFNEFDTM